MRVQPEFLDTIDAWREAQPDKPSRSEAIRQLVEVGLKAAQGPEPQDGRDDGG